MDSLNDLGDRKWT